MKTTSKLFLGVDLGGTKIEAAIVDHSGNVVVRERVATPRDDYDATLRAIDRLCDRVERQAKHETRLPLGIGTPGSLSPKTGLLRNCNSVALNNRSLDRDLERISGRKVRIANDADCLALSEAISGAGRNYSTVFAIILGTGVGGSLVVAGKLLQGPNRITGEWGHNPISRQRSKLLNPALERPRLCYCGNFDCVETWLSGPGLAEIHEQLHGSDVSIEQLGAAIPDERHRKTLEIYSEILASALSGVVNIVDPEVVVFAGGLSNVDELIRLTRQKLPEHLFSDTCKTILLGAEHGDSSGVRGAAFLWRGA
ncbi:MAG: ROK family protein [Pseudomonadota bacterium]